MTAEEFRAACLAAIAPYYDPQVDGPLLIAVRDQSHAMSNKEWVVYPEYAAAIAHWPAGYLTAHEPLFESADEVLADLVSRARQTWRERQPEPDDEPDLEPSDPFAGTAWATSR